MKSFLLSSLLIFIIFANTNYSQWVQVALPNVSINCLTFNSDGTILFAGTDNSGIQSTSNNGDTWQRRDNGAITSSVNAINTQAITNNAYLAGTNNGLFISQDLGNTWYTPGVTGITDSHINTLCWDSNGDTFLGTNSGIFYAPRNSGAYTLRNAGLTDLTINALCQGANPQVGEYLWCGTNNGLYLYQSGSWIKKSPITSRVNSILVWNMILVAIDVGLYESNNGGVYWGGLLSDTHVPDNNYLSMCLQTTADPTNMPLFIGTSPNGRVYISTNWGGHIDDKSTGLSVSRINSLAIMGPYLIAGTNNGIWRRTVLQLTSVDNQYNSIPNNYSLKQNYPNPFNPSTVINYQLPVASFVTLKVYDVLGNEVATLVKEYQQAGNFNSQFSIQHSQLVSGVYFYTIKTGDFTETKKMILLK